MNTPEQVPTRPAIAAMCDGATAVARVVRQFATDDEVHALVASIRSKPWLFRAVEGSFGVGPRYRVIDGLAVYDDLPEIVAFGERRIRALAESFAGRPLAPSRRLPHEIRIQHFTEPHHNFRWHYDGHTYNALLTLVNSNGSETQIVAPRLSRMTRRVYPLVALTPRVLSVLPHQDFTTLGGDVLLLRGEGLLHRGISRDLHGERLLVVFCFNEVGKPVRRGSWLRRRIAHALNFGYADST